MGTISVILVLAVMFIAASGEANASQYHSSATGNTKDERVMMGYSDSWVVEVEGGRDEADRLADEHGFVNLGQVSASTWCK